VPNPAPRPWLRVLSPCAVATTPYSPHMARQFPGSVGILHGREQVRRASALVQRDAHVPVTFHV
jgi:hypothetical protein